MAEEPDLLSQLPDELLQHILHLAPSREAESTAVLSRRWCGLWPPATGAVKIDISSRDRDALLRGAEEALAAARGPVQRLSIHVREPCYYSYDDDDDIIGDVFSSHPAFRGVQDVRIRADDTSSRLSPAAGGDDDDDGFNSWLPGPGVGYILFSFGAVPSAALRVLHVTNCYDLKPPPPASTFPCLEVLRLRTCRVSVESLQDIVVASPQLAALQLEYVYFLATPTHTADIDENEWWGGHGHRYYRWELPQSLCCPGVTTLVLLNCCSEHEDVAIELDVPRVQHFKYRGRINQFAVRSPLPALRRAHLHILHSCYDASGDFQRCESFWNFLKNFNDAKVLKLKLRCPIDYVVALERKRIMNLLVGTLFNVEHLEIDAPVQNPESEVVHENVGVAIGNLLQYCPVVRDLRINLHTADQWRKYRSTSLYNKAQLEFHKSIDHFKRRRDLPVVPLCGDDGKFEASDIPGLSDRWFHFRCLQFGLKRLSLKFHMDKDNPNCIGVRLAKFFVERGTALEEMYIDDGNMKLWEHMNCKIISAYQANPQPFSEFHVLATMSQATMNELSSSKISGWFHHHQLEVRRTTPWCASRSFTILPLADQ